MKIEVKKISKILNEMITFAISEDAEKVDISIENNKELYKLIIKANNVKCSSENVDNLRKHLNAPRQKAAEEYYWELTGDSETGSELALVGMMVDKAIVTLNEDNLYIELHRYK